MVMGNKLILIQNKTHETPIERFCADVQYKMRRKSDLQGIKWPEVRSTWGGRREK